ncbi:hypothetical protein AVEN_6281-1 [Araneus ventricosus]|uniref:Uncharacterized protein n=1 Tax=Araneus ventricosus TaxID=182803 RepID=A0A4Y2N568_ARAVE|nr:hypothetical protein AVEN_6281-1 [Araneus ventricosus]
MEKFVYPLYTEAALGGFTNWTRKQHGAPSITPQKMYFLKFYDVCILNVKQTPRHVLLTWLLYQLFAPGWIADRFFISLEKLLSPAKADTRAESEKSSVPLVLMVYSG